MASAKRSPRALCSTSGPAYIRATTNNCVQASEYMNDEEGVQELCKQAARWLFESTESVLPRPHQASDQAAAQRHSEPSVDRFQVDCLQGLSKRAARCLFGSKGSLRLGRDQASGQAASQEYSALSEDRIQVRYLCAYMSASASPESLLCVFYVLGMHRRGLVTIHKLRM